MVTKDDFNCFYSRLKSEFERKLGRELTGDEIDFLKWLSQAHLIERQKSE